MILIGMTTADRERNALVYFDELFLGVAAWFLCEALALGIIGESSLKKRIIELIGCFGHHAPSLWHADEIRRSMFELAGWSSG
jgi:hypothetical protein